jgi:hypothetical protein
MYLLALAAFLVGGAVGVAIARLMPVDAAPKDAAPRTASQASEHDGPLLLEPAMLAQELRRHTAEHKRYERPFSIFWMECDVDEEPTVRAVTERLRNTVRFVDQMGFCGRRVVLIMPQTSADGARVAADRLAAHAEEVLPKERFVATCSTWPDDEAEIESLMAILEKQAGSLAPAVRENVRRQIAGP